MKKSQEQREVQFAFWIQVLTVFIPLIYLAVYTIVSAYRNIKMFKKGYQGVATNSDAAHVDSLGFPARLLESNADYNTF